MGLYTILSPPPPTHTHTLTIHILWPMPLSATVTVIFFHFWDIFLFWKFDFMCLPPYDKSPHLISMFAFDTGFIILHDGANEAFWVPGRRLREVSAQGVCASHGPDQATQGQSGLSRSRLAIFSSHILTPAPPREARSSWENRLGLLVLIHLFKAVRACGTIDWFTYIFKFYAYLLNRGCSCKPESLPEVCRHSKNLMYTNWIPNIVMYS